jgi:ABC-2 family transporter protein
MNGALLRKELRELLPWGVLSIVLGTFDVLTALFSQPDMRPLNQTYGSLGGPGAYLFWFIAVAIGTGLATREQDDRTLAFLDALPVSRSRIFLMKMSVAFGLVMLAPLVGFALVIALHLLSRDSLQQALHLDVLLLIFAQHALAMAAGLLLGAALGRLRSLTWLAFGSLAAGLLIAIEHYPQAAALDPTALLEPRVFGSRVHFDALTVQIQLALCLVAGWLAWRGFTRVHRAPLLNLDLPTRPVVSAIVSTLTIGVVGFGVYLLASQRAEEMAADDAIVPEKDEPYFAPSTPAQTQTTHYRFSYPTAEANAARELAGRADDIFEQVHELLGVPLGGPIQVDASGSAQNTHGTAFFGRIRMVLDEEASLVLAHETAHVVSSRTAGNERAWLWEAAPALNEGLATWVHSNFGATEQQRAGRLALAALHARRELIVEEFADPATLGRLRDAEIQYPLGDALITATVKLHGKESVPVLLRAFADPRLPSNLRGISLWQAVYQSAGMDLGAILDEFYREVDAHREQHAKEISQLPRPRVRVVTNGRLFGVQVLVDRPLTESQALYVRFKPSANSEVWQIESVRVSHEFPVWREHRKIGGGVICVQPGVAIAASQVLFESWTCLPTADASLWQAEPLEAE